MSIYENNNATMWYWIELFNIYLDKYKTLVHLMRHK